MSVGKNFGMEGRLVSHISTYHLDIHMEELRRMAEKVHQSMK
jgi:hypothetical protein